MSASFEKIGRWPDVHVGFTWAEAGSARVNRPQRAVRSRQDVAMTLRVQAIDIDANDNQLVASFWEQLLGWRRTYEDDDEIVLEPPTGSPEEGVAPDLLVLKVPDGKAFKNRVHLDLRPDDQAAEVARAESLGARRVSIGQDDSVTWVVMADPEGNEFCILRALRPEELDANA
jgi:predicted enzyme related to lactoylglutathione lyase